MKTHIPVFSTGSGTAALSDSWIRDDGGDERSGNENLPAEASAALCSIEFCTVGVFGANTVAFSRSRYCDLRVAEMHLECIWSKHVFARHRQTPDCNE